MIAALNKAEQKLAQYLANARYAAATKRNRQPGVVGPQSVQLSHLEGVAAEIAFCKLCNVYPDLDIDADAVLPDFDCTTPEHGRVDVKVTKYLDGNLIAYMGKVDHCADCYALMVGEFAVYECKGWATAAELFRTENVRDLGHGPVYALPQNRLRKI